MFKFIKRRKRKNRPQRPASRWLSVELLESLTYPGEIPASQQTDRREVARVCVGTRAQIRLGQSDAAPFSVLVRDISIKSIGLLLDQPITPGDRCSIYIPKRSNPLDHVGVSCIIDRCVRAGLEQSVYLVVATFVEGVIPALPPLPEAQQKPAAVTLPRNRGKSSLFQSPPIAVTPSNPDAQYNAGQ